MNQHAEHETPALEPAGDVLAVDDPLTGWGLRGVRLPALAMPSVAAILLLGTIGLWQLGIAGQILLVWVLATATLFGFGCLLLRRYRGWIGPATRLFASQPWRPADVAVFRQARSTACRLRVQESGGEPVWLGVLGLSWSAQQVLARTGRVWLVGPDADGQAAIRSAGLTVPLSPAQLTRPEPDDVLVQAQQSAPRRAPRAADDVVLAKVLAGPRRRARTDLVVPVLLLVLAVGVLVSVLRGNTEAPRHDELVWSVLVVIVLVAGFGCWRLARLLRYRRIDAMLAAGPWQSLPIEVTGQPGARSVRGRVTLADGAVLQVAVPRAGFVLAANVSATGLLWVAGAPAAGRRTVVGLPGYPLIAMAAFTA